MNRTAVIATIGAVVIAAIIALASTFTVHQSEQALVLQLGKPVRVSEDPGLDFKLPFLQDVVYFSKQVLNFDAPSEEVPTLDQKQVIVSAFARFKIDDALKFFQSVTNEIGAQARLAPIISSNLRRALGGIPMLDILTERRAIYMRQIAEQVNVEAKTFGIEVIDVRIKRVDLPEANSQAVFRRMQTQREQEARRSRAQGLKEAQTLRAEADKQQVVILAEARKKSAILHGEGDAEATRIYNEAYGRDAQFFDFFRSLQAMNEALAGESTTYVGPATGDFFRFFGSQVGPAGAGQ
jgi:membrane protease subunit HflC